MSDDEEEGKKRFQISNEQLERLVRHKPEYFEPDEFHGISNELLKKMMGCAKCQNIPLDIL